MKNIVKAIHSCQRHGRYMKGSVKWDRYQNPIVRKGRRCVYWNTSVDDPNGRTMWWVEEERRWATFEDANETGSSYSTCGPYIHSVKAAIRHVKNHTELPVGSVLYLMGDLSGVYVKIRVVGKTR